jgi:hypothetical protein
MLDLGLFSLTQLLIFNVTTKTLNPCLMLYMTKTEYEKLELRRDYISFFGFTLIMLNLLIGLAVIIGSIITGESLITHPVSLVSVLGYSHLNWSICIGQSCYWPETKKG